MSIRHIKERFITAQENYLSMKYKVESFTKELEAKELSEEDLKRYEPILKNIANELSKYLNEYTFWTGVIYDLNKPNVDVRGKSRNRIAKYNKQNKCLADFVTKRDKEIDEKFKQAKIQLEEHLKSGELK